MKAISLWQPWASLIAAGVKPFETRHWAPPDWLVGQTIAICAAKKIGKENRAFACDLMFGQVCDRDADINDGFDLAAKVEATWAGEDCPDELMGIFGQATMPIGCVVATATLTGAFQLGEPAEGTARPAMSVTRRMISRPFPECFTVKVDEWGDYSPGRWAWLFQNVKAITPPVPVIGRQGIFDMPPGWLAP